MKQGLWFRACVCVCVSVCVCVGVHLFIIHTESLLDKFLMCREIQRFEASGMLGVATIKLLRLQIRGVSFKKERSDVNSKRHCCLAWFLQYNGLLGGAKSRHKTQFTCLRCSVYSLGISWCFYPEIYSEMAGRGSVSYCRTHTLFSARNQNCNLKASFCRSLSLTNSFNGTSFLFGTAVFREVPKYHEILHIAALKLHYLIFLNERRFK